MPLDMTDLPDDYWRSFSGEPDWAALHNYVCMPYAHNAQRVGQITGWFDELYARRESDGIEPTLCHVTGHADTAKPGDAPYRFDAFKIGDVYFSHDVGVLTLPHRQHKIPSKLPLYQPASSAGIWLHDFPVPAAEQDLYKNILADNEPSFYPHAHSLHDGYHFYQANRGAEAPDGTKHLFPAAASQILDTIKSQLMRGDLPGTHTDLFVTPGVDPFFQFARFEMPDNRHWNDEARDEWHTDAREQEWSWGRAVLHTALGQPALYRTGPAGCIIVATPPGATSSHVMGGYGIEHRGQDDEQGRVLLAHACAMRRAEISPWRMERTTAPQLMLKVA